MVFAQAELGRIVEELESGLPWWNTDFNKEIEEGTGQAEIRERISGPDHGRRLERTVSRVWNNWQDRCQRPGQVQADRWNELRNYFWLNSLPQLRYVSVQTAFFAEDTRGCWIVLLLKAAELSRYWQRNCGGAAARKRHSTMWNIEQLSRRCDCEARAVLDGFHCSNLEKTLQEGALGHGSVERSTDELWIGSQN